MRALKPSDVSKTRRKRRVELADIGEVLTNDKVLERLQKVDAEKASKKAKKTGGKTKKGTIRARSQAQQLVTTPL